MALHLSLVGDIVRATRRQPRLIRWWLRNRWRQATLFRDYKLRGDGSSRAPRSVSLRPTFLCNLNCLMCSFANSASADGDVAITREAEMLDIETAKRLADDLSRYRTCIGVTGGEPYLWPHLFEFIDYAHGRGLPVSLTTNGSLLAKRFDELREAPPDALTVSILGPRDTHDHIVGREGAYDRLVEGLRMVADLKGGDRLAPPMLVLNTPMLPENAADFHELIELTTDLPVAANHYQHLWFTTPSMRRAMDECGATVAGNYTESIAIDTDGIDATCIWQGIERARALANGRPVLFYPQLSKRDVERYYREPEALVGRSKAVCAWIFCHVMPDGDISPCLGFVGGNLGDGAFMDVWNSEKFRAFRRSLREHRTLPICSRCCVFFRKD